MEYSNPLTKPIVYCGFEEIENILEKPYLFMSFEEATEVRREEKWKGEVYLFLNRIGDRLRIYSKSNTIAITNFFKNHFNECFIKDNPTETIKNMKNKIWENENEKELFTRIIKDYYWILKAYYDFFFEEKNVKTEYTLPVMKKNYKNIPLEKRIRLKNEHILVRRKFGRLKIDEIVKKNKEIIKKITTEDVCKWVDYIMLWGTYFGILGEIYVMNFLQREVKEIRWRWGTEKEDVEGIDIVGEYKNITIKIQVKLTRGGRIGEKGIDYSNVITIYVNINGEVFIAPKGLGEIGWKGFFNEIVRRFSNV